MSLGFFGASEFYPLAFDTLVQSAKRRAFLRLYNAYFDSNLNGNFFVSEKYLEIYSNLNDIFCASAFDLLATRRFSLAPRNPAKLKEKTAFCATSNAIIQAFLRGEPLKFSFYPPQMRAAKFIASFALGGLWLDAQDCFANLVFSRIRARHADKQISLKNGCVVVSVNGEAKFAVMPFLKRVGEDWANDLSGEITRALSVRNERLDFYVVVPRNANFRRFVELGENRGEAKFRLVPYSICNKIF